VKDQDVDEAHGKSEGVYSKGVLGIWWSQALDPLLPIVQIFARHCYLPTTFMECEFIPLVKDKGGDIILVSNYMATVISNVETKLLESC